MVQQEYTFRVNTVDQNLASRPLASGKFQAPYFNRILQLHFDNNNQTHIFIGEASPKNGAYSKIRVGSLVTDNAAMTFNTLSIKSGILSPMFFYDEQSASIKVGAIVNTLHPNSSNSLFSASYSLGTKKWDNPIVAIKKASDIALNTEKNILRDFTPKAGGGGIYLLEKSFEEVKTRGRSMAMMPSGMLFGGGTYSYSVYHNDNLMAVSVNANGEIEWQKEITKSQQSSLKNDATHSYATLKYPIGNILLFADQHAGENKFITAFLSKDGILQHRQFASASYPRMEDDQILIQRAKQITVNEIVIPVLKRRTISFAKIQF
jgi:hypothetical protein